MERNRTSTKNPETRYIKVINGSACHGNKCLILKKKYDLVLGSETLVGKHSDRTFLVVGHQVCSHLRRDFGPLLTETLEILLLVNQGFSSPRGFSVGLRSGAVAVAQVVEQIIY